MPEENIPEENTPEETTSIKMADLEEVTTEAIVATTEEIQEDISKVASNFESFTDESETAEESSSERASNTAEETVTVQPVKFASFEDLSQTQGEANKNLDLLMDIKLQLTVELGRTELPIKKVLELTRGSIIELEKIAGEPVELFANGKLVAKGEVVVIEDNFGLRITSITDTEDRLKGL